MVLKITSNSEVAVENLSFQTCFLCVCHTNSFYIGRLTKAQATENWHKQ